MYRSRPIALLRIALALVMGSAALRLVLAAHAGALHDGVHPILMTALGVAETLGALLFLIPRTLRAGAWLLAACLVVGTLLHLHSGNPPSPIFLVYAAGIYAVAAE